jgi:hypothetical protein
MTDTAVATLEPVHVELGVVRADRPHELVTNATEAANALASVIDSKKLFTAINGRRYVRVEGWTTLAAMLGCLPREVSVSRDPEGTYTATVELARMSDGAVLTRASAECGMDEPTWAKRPDYARRSMAVTRATSKACRIAFSWVMVLAGYEATPSEEIPTEEAQERQAPNRSPRVDGPKASEAPGPVWPVGAKKGTPLKDLKSDELVAALAWIRKSGKATELAEPIEAILASREGE